MQRTLYLVTFVLGLALGVSSMIRGIDRHLARRGKVDPLNMPTLAAFATAFGAVGYLLVRYTGLGHWTDLGVALGAGVAGGTGMFALIAGWALPSAKRDVEDERFLLQGHLGQVTRAIADGGTGEITYEYEGARHAVPARGLDGESIDAGTEVVIERIEDGTAHVARWSEIAKELKLPA
jgi:membrane protein implicated in regulation of membrane protease activity